MPKVTPSQAVALIDRIFPWARQGEQITGGTDLTFGVSSAVSTIVELIEQIPDELITLEGDDYAGFAASLSTLKHALSIWPVRGALIK